MAVNNLLLLTIPKNHNTYTYQHLSSIHAGWTDPRNQKKKSKNRRVFFYSRIIKISLKSYSKEREKIEMQTDRQTKNVHNYMRIRKKLIIIKKSFLIYIHTYPCLFGHVSIHVAKAFIWRKTSTSREKIRFTDPM